MYQTDTFVRQVSYLIVVVLILASCDCRQEVTGKIFDNETKFPIDHVAVGNYEKENTEQPYSRRYYSDSTGHFNYHSISGGLFGCPDVELYFSKEGYVTSKLNFNSSSRD